MDANFTCILEKILPKTDHTPHLLLRSREDCVVLYTNYPLVTGIPPEICADAFNRQTQIGKAAVQGDFVHFTLSHEELYTILRTIADDYHPGPPALPNQPAAYLQYVITVLLETYPAMQARHVYTPQERNIATLLLYMAQRTENAQKRQHELKARITAFLNHTVFTELAQETRLLLRAAHVMLQPSC